MSQDAGALADRHVAAEFELESPDATIETMTADPVVLHVPTLAGGRGRDAVRAFYRDRFIGTWPADIEVEQVSRTVGESRVVDELILRFTHTTVIPVLLPGVPPTGRTVELPHVVVFEIEGDRIAHEHIYWDQASLLVQVGLLDPSRVPAIGSEQAGALRDNAPSNLLLDDPPTP